MKLGNIVTFNSVFPVNTPKEIIEKLERSYNEIKKNFLEMRYEPSELNGAKFCEATYRLLEWYTSNSYTPFDTKLRDFSQSTKKFENMSNFQYSVRFHIPKILDVLYGIRNHRGVGHLSGNIDPNYMDSVFIVSASDWVMAELVRLFHNLNTDEAQKLVQSIVTKKLQVVWQTSTVKRVLNNDLSYKDKTLLLLYNEPMKSVTDTELFKWVEHSNMSIYKRDVLRVCHKERLLEYNETIGEITLSPKGVQYVEKILQSIYSF